MKQIYKKLLLLSIMAIGPIALAQSYCTLDPEATYGVEEITNIIIDDLEYTNTNTVDLLVDLTALSVDGVRGQSYPISIQGNSYGPYVNEYLLFVDWNQNGILDDQGEVYYLGQTFSSNGFDDQFASAVVQVPSTALLGPTRARFTKTYTEEIDDYFLNPDPCHISVYDAVWDYIDDSFGQAIDFTVNVIDDTAGVNPIAENGVKVYPNPVVNELNLITTQNIEKIEIYNLTGQMVYTKQGSNLNKLEDLSGLSQGMYLVKASSDKQTYTVKFTKK